MESVSPSLAIKRLDGDIRQILRGQDISRANSRVRQLLADLEQDLIDARKYVQGYELSETREEQVDNAKVAKRWLVRARKCVLSASEQNIFGAIDVAHLSAQMEQIIAQLK